MSSVRERICPGCGLSMPEGASTAVHTYFNSSPECWAVYGEILDREYSNPLLFSAVHVLTTNAYAVQHPGGAHPDKSVDVHLAGLFLTEERGFRSPEVPPLMQLLAERVARWPHFAPPKTPATMTVFDVALADESEHVAAVERWAGRVWASWSEHHAAIGAFVDAHLKERAQRRRDRDADAEVTDPHAR